MAALLLGHALLIAILILHFPTYINSSPPTAPLPSNTNTQYIRTTCNYTTYPRLCYHSLSIYASKIKTNPKLLANTALNITFKATESTSRLMKKMSRIHGLNPGVAAALVDCMEVVGDSVYELQRSIGEMGHASGANFYGVMEDIQTWVSAALTDDTTCIDGFDEQPNLNGNVKRIVRKHILKISHLTSNALALINNYASSQARLP
ncbi:21 kDa protein isoform X1 [Ricinus communis]|uniref:21 kDa protein isoform X1 n=1 Tax=Ricinus communis TaxID=3988 RepID=UPI00077246F9|nr:21 kDa protein isoform X1 [Ricinus communis]|eukprot:XP_015573662.1 21 kDa protein [Ricinus communis]